MASAVQATSASQPSGRAKSCTECRQVKLACDAKLNFPSPCSRCTARKLECKLDSSFKRIPTRKRIEQFTAEIHSLRAAVNSVQSGAGSSEGIVDQPAPPQLAIHDFRTSNEMHSTSAIKLNWLNLNIGEIPESRTCGAVFLSPETIVELLSHFDVYYFPHLPILEPISSISTLFDRSELLFWTIVLVSSQWHPSLSYLYHELIVPHENLLGSVLQNSIRSVEIVQSLLILCLWPVPRIRQSSDPAWIYSGMAISAAVQIGLRQPLADNYSFEDLFGWTRKSLSHLSVRTKVLTWLSCFNINVQISMFMGYPPQLCGANQLEQISAICRDSQSLLPRSFIAFTEIQRQIGRYNTELDGIPNNDTQNSLTSLFDTELDAIKSNFGDVWSAELDTYLQAAKLYLYALSFSNEQRLLSNNSSPKSKLSVPVQMVFQKGLVAAAQLINTASNLQNNINSLPPAINNSVHTTSGSSHLLFYPKPFFTNSYFAAIFQLRYLAVQRAASHSDREIAINSTTSAHEFFKIFSTSRDHKRAAVLIEVLGRMTRSGGHPVGLQIKDRLGASLIFDTSMAAAMIRNRNRQTTSSGQLQPWLTLNDAQELPPTPKQLAQYMADNSGSSQGALSTTDSSNVDTDMQMEQGWSWGFWDNALFDSLGVNPIDEAEVASYNFTMQ